MAKFEIGKGAGRQNRPAHFCQVENKSPIANFSTSLASTESKALLGLFLVYSFRAQRGNCTQNSRNTLLPQAKKHGVKLRIA